ncbi:unnamed protein product [Pylaiella littoralis]
MALRSGGQPSTSVVVPRPAQSLPAHPDAARDLAAVCRCLGELGASVFTSSTSSVPPAFRGSAPYWNAAEGGAGDSDEKSGGKNGGGGARVVTERGVALLA